MKFEAATIKDIGKALGLSTSTVSRALRDSYEISEATKQFVLDYARKINYKPNPIALSLRNQKSKSIGVIVAEIANSFSSQAINGIECVANKKGYNVIIAQSFESYETELNVSSFLASRGVDGCLVSVSSETTDFSHFTDLQERGFPIVFFDRIIENMRGHTVAIDNEQAAYDSTLQLLKNNYHRVAFLADAPGQYVTRKKLEGYKRALAKYDIEFDESLVKYCIQSGMHYDEVDNTLAELFEQEDKPDAIFASTDKLTISCMRFCKKFHINIPEEVGLSGFSNSDMNDMLQPSLTAIKQPAFLMGKIATELLIKTIEAKRPVDFENQLLPSELNIGESSRPRRMVYAV
jgi:DNA-binding LacI/PurR family transcriptional regulator